MEHSPPYNSHRAMIDDNRFSMTGIRSQRNMKVVASCGTMGIAAGEQARNNAMVRIG